MDADNKIGPDEEIIEGRFRSSDGPPEFPLANTPGEKIVFVEVEKPVDRIVYRDAPPTEHHHYHTPRPERYRTPYQRMTGPERNVFWVVVAMGLLGFVMLTLSFMR